MTFRQKSSFEYCSYISLSFAQILSYITLVIALYPYTVTKRFQDWSFSTFGEDQEIVQITSNDWRAGIIPEDNVFGEAGGRRSLVVRGLSVILTLQPKFLDRVRTWTCRVCGAFAFAVDLTDSKGRISAYLLLVSLCDLRPSISSSFFRFNNGVWSFLDYILQISAGRPLRLSSNLWPKRFGFIVIYTWFLLLLRTQPVLFPLLMLFVLYACFQ